MHAFSVLKRQRYSTSFNNKKDDAHHMKIKLI